MYCPVDGWDLWKTCERFELGPAYKDEYYESKVRKTKGSDYMLQLNKIKEPIDIKRSRNKEQSYQEKVFHDGIFHLKAYEGYIKGRMYAKYGVGFARGYKIRIGEELVTFSLVSSDEKIVVSARDYVFERDRKTERREEEIFSSINREVVRLNMLPENVLKILVIVKALTEGKDDKVHTVAWRYCEKNKDVIKRIRVIEVDEEGNLYEIV